MAKTVDLKKTRIREAYRRLFSGSFESKLELVKFLEEALGESFESTKDLRDKVRAYITRKVELSSYLPTSPSKKPATKLSGANSGNLEKRPRRIKPVEKKYEPKF